MSSDNIFARSAIRWVRVLNVDSQTAPPYALLAMAGVDNQGRVQVQRPQSDNQTGLLISGPGPIPTGLEGQAHRSFPAIVAYQSGTPANGQTWGAAANSWYLTSGKTGYQVVGGAAANLVNVVDTPPAAAAGGMFAVCANATPQMVLFSDGGTLAVVPAMLYSFSSPPVSIWLTDPDLANADPNSPPSNPSHTWQGTNFVQNWSYLCVSANNPDTHGVPLYYTCSPPDAALTHRGLVSVGGQQFSGTKQFSQASDTQSNANIVCDAALAVGPQNYTDTSGYPHIIYAELGIGTMPPGWGSIPGAMVLCKDANTVGALPTGQVWVTNQGILFGPPNSFGSTFSGGPIPPGGPTTLNIAAGNNLNYQGTTGMDTAGSIFINGLCVVVGSNPLSGSLDGGSYW